MIQHLVGLSHWQIDLLVIYLFVQGAFFTIFPEEVVLPTLGVLWGRGRVGFAEAFASAAVGLALGDLILVLIGRYLGMKILVRRPFSWIIDRETLARALGKVRRWGDWLVFLVRFTPTVRAPMYFAAGVSEMPLGRFFRSDIAGMVFWVPALILFGRHLGASGNLDSAFHKIGLIMLAVVGTGLTISILREKQRRAQYQALRVLEEEAEGEES